MDIEDADTLYRRLVKHHVSVKDGAVTVKANAFMLGNQKPDKDVSVNLAKLVESPTSVAVSSKGNATGLGELITGTVRGKEIGLCVIHTPSKTTPSHTSIRGMSSTNEYDITRCHLLAENTSILITPPASDK